MTNDDQLTPNDDFSDGRRSDPGKEVPLSRLRKCRPDGKRPTNRTGAKRTKSHSLLDYFSKSNIFTKKAQQPLPEPYDAHARKNATCRYCDKDMCTSCTRPCESCHNDYCTFCSRVDYGGVVERNLCFDCLEERNNGGEGDVDMMDL